MNRIRLLTCVAVALLTGPAVLAVPIDYTFSGVATGALDGVDYTRADFVFTLWADTDDIVMTGAGVFNVPAMMASVEVDGFGVATILDEVGVFSNNTVPGIGLGAFAGGVNDFDLLDLTNTLGSYSLDTSFGPLFNAVPFLSFILGLNTDLGLLEMDFDSARDVTFQATLKASVPVPATPLLVALGLAAGLGARRRHRRVR